MTLVSIVAENQDRVEIHVLGRLHPEAEHYWDGNWISVEIEIRVGAWWGKYSADLRVDEFIAFRQQIDGMSTSESAARFESMETWLELTLEADRSGRITMKGVARDQPGIGNRLEFRLERLDPAGLPAIAAQIRKIEASFPLRGERR